MAGTLSTLDASQPLSPFALPTPQRGVAPTGAYVYDVHPDGQRFIVSTPPQAGETASVRAVPLTIVTNWTSLLRQ